MKKMESINSETKLSEAKVFLRQNFKEGAICPCCNGVVKLYKRTITSSMAWGLILFAKHQKNHEYVFNPDQIHTSVAKGKYHLEDFLKSCNVPSSIRGDMPKLMFWGLIEGIGSKNSGCYKVTDKGFDFIDGKITVPEYFEIYNNKAFGQSLNNISITEALKNKFDLNKLLND